MLRLSTSFATRLFLAVFGSALITACAGGSTQGAPATSGGGPAQATTPPTAKWAKSVVASASKSVFFAAERDTADNILAVGYQQNDTAVTYGIGVSVTASANFNALNAVLVKYSSGGIAQWARTVTTGPGDSNFFGVTADDSDNVYAVGYYRGANADPRTFGLGVVATSPLTSTADNAVIVKYNSTGVAQWARSLIAGSSGNSRFLAVRAHVSGIYAAGFQTNSTVTWAPGISTTCAGTCAIIVKYSAAGAAEWAVTVSGGYSYFYSIAIDSVGNLVLAGTQKTTTTHTFAAGITASGVNVAENAIVAKYSSAGIAQWVRTVTAAASSSEYFSVTTDTSGNIFATGYQYGQAAFTYGPGIFVTAPHSTNNIVIVKYDTSGTAIWARTLTSGTGYSVLTGISVDSSGHIFCAGQQYDTGTFNWGNGITTKGKSSQNPLLIKFDAMGSVLWARTADGVSDGHYYTVALDSSGDPFVSGFQQVGTFTYGPGVTITGVNALGNSLIIKYFK